jgi:hypothetical protein
MKNRLHAATAIKTVMVLFYCIAFLKESIDTAICCSNAVELTGGFIE